MGGVAADFELGFHLGGAAADIFKPVPRLAIGADKPAAVILNNEFENPPWCDTR